MTSGAQIALAVGLGYLLGRRRKLRTALTLAAAVAAGRASRSPGGFRKATSDLLAANPQLANLGKLGAPLVTAGRAAATAAASNGIDVLSGTLRGGADALRRATGAGRAAAEPSSDGRGPGTPSARPEPGTPPERPGSATPPGRPAAGMPSVDERSAPDEEQELDEQPEARDDRVGTGGRRRGR